MLEFNKKLIQVRKKVGILEESELLKLYNIFNFEMLLLFPQKKKIAITPNVYSSKGTLEIIYVIVNK